MKISKMTAVIISLILVLGGSWFRARITFSSFQNQLNTQFTEGTDRDGIAIASDIKEKINIVKNTVTVAERTSGLDDQTVNKAEKAVEEIENSHSFKETGQKEQKLDQAFDLLIKEMDQAELSKKDRKYVNGFKADYKAAAHRIEKDPYQQLVIETEEKTSGALASVLKTVTFSHLDIYGTGE